MNSNPSAAAGGGGLPFDSRVTVVPPANQSPPSCSPAESNAAASGACEQSQPHGPFRHDDLFESLFEPNAFPHFFRVFEECDIELPTASSITNSYTASASDSGATIKFCITDEGFKKMAECYIARNRVDQSQGRSDQRTSDSYSYKNLTSFLKANKQAAKAKAEAKAAEAKAEAKAAEVKSAEAISAEADAAEAKAAEAKAAEVQAQSEYTKKLMNLVLSLPLSERYRQEKETKSAAAKSNEATSAAAKSNEATSAAAEFNEATSAAAKSNEATSAAAKSNEATSAAAESNEATSAEAKTTAAKYDESQTAATCWAVMRSVLSPNAATKPDRTDPFFSLCLWLLNHCTIPHKPPPNPNQKTRANEPNPMPHKCRAEAILRAFSSQPDDRKNFEDMVTLVRFCHLLHFWHRDSFASKSQCIFELCYCSTSMSMFNLCSESDATRSLQECTKLIERNYLALEARVPSILTTRWILLEAGRSVKQWGHHSSSDFEKCEVEKESNFCEKWRHLIYSYAIMSLLYSEFNGNKQGPIGSYDFREKCKIGSVGSSTQKFVYASKATSDAAPSEASDYLGHNIVALAVCKRGSVLRVSYNHNVLFSSTVDHAEERLIDGLFKDPSAFIEKSHARIFSEGQRVNIEDHMKHISVYTSLEPCQQCSGKLHIAEVPELVFCQRDWDIQLLQAQLYEKFRKCRSIPASNFEFTPYQELSSGYYNFQSDRRKTFFSLGDRKVEAKTTMPYFLCTDYAQMIFCLGHKVFDEDLKLLFLGGDTWTTDDKRKIQEFADKHGLHSAHEWLDKAKSIRDYRPLLNRKQKRVLYDELCSSRIEWIQLYHKRECSVTMQFDSSSKVNEHEIDLNFASLVDIKSIYLPRDLDGSLKGTATLVCSSPAAAKQFLALFKLSNDAEQDKKKPSELEKKSHIEDCLDDSGEIAIRQKSDLSNLKRAFLKKAADWLYSNRRIQDEELFVPFDLPELSTQQKLMTALLLEWYQKKNEIKTKQKKIKLELLDLSAKIQASQSSESTKQMLRVVAIGGNGRTSAAEKLLDNKVMYVVLKNANGPGCTLCTWIGHQTPANQQNGSKKHPAQVQIFLKSSIHKLLFDRTLYKKKNDFQNPQTSDVHGAASEDEMDKDGAPATAQEEKGKKKKEPKKKKEAELKYICFANTAEVSESLKSMDSGSGDIDWMVFQYSDDAQWDESEEDTSPKLRTESLGKDLTKSRVESLLCDINYERKMVWTCQGSESGDCPSGGVECSPKLLHRHEQQIFCFKANNSSQARRLRQMLPNLDAPNHTVLWSSSAPSSVFSQTDGKGSTVSLIVRDDVTDASVMQFLQKVLKTDLLPSIRCRSKANLRACDSSENGIEWLDIYGASIESRKWKLLSFQFRCRITVDYQRYLTYCDLSAAGHDEDFVWDSRHFCQPFSQPVLDLMFLRADLQSYRKLKFDIKEMIENYFVWKQNDAKPHLALTVTGSEKTYYFEVSSNGNAKIKKHVANFNGCTIEMDHNSLANFLFSDALCNPLIKKKFQSILDHGKNFWGKDKAMSLKWNKTNSGPIVLQTLSEAKADVEAAKSAAAEEFWKVLEIWKGRAAISVLEHTQPLESLESFASSQDSITASGTIKWPKAASDTEILCSAMAHVCTISCCYCGCNYVIPQCVRDKLAEGGQGVFCCSSHADRDEKRTKIQLPISNFNKPDKATQSIQDPARDKNLAKLFQRICEIEKLLRLNISVGFQYFLYFKSSENEISPLKIQCQFLRDENDGPAHLSFCIEGPPDVLCQIVQPSATEARKTRSKKKADFMRDYSLKDGLQVIISSSQPIDGASHFKTSLSVYPEFHEHEMPLCFGDGKLKIKTQVCRVYGRVAPENGIATCNEGNKLPAEWMRRVLEPEYYQSSTAVFPVVKFELIVPQCGAASVPGDSVTYVAESALSYCEELESNDKHSRPEDKTESDPTDAALKCFREVLNAENQLSKLAVSLGPLKRQLQESSNGAVAGGGMDGGVIDDDGEEDDDDDDGDDNDADQPSDINTEKKCVWLVFLKSSSKRGVWMELFHSPQKIEPPALPYFSDVFRLQLAFPKQLPDGKTKEDLVDFSRFCSDERANGHLKIGVLNEFFKLILKKHKRSYQDAFNLLKEHEDAFQKDAVQKALKNESVPANVSSADDAAVESRESELFDADNVPSSSSHHSASSFGRVDSGRASSACPEALSPLVFLAKSLMDYVMKNCVQEASQISADCVPIWILKQKAFPEDIRAFLFNETYDAIRTEVTEVTAEKCATLSRFLPPKLDLCFQLVVAQEHFDKAIDALLEDDARDDGSAVKGNDGSAVKGNDGSAVKGNDGSAVKGNDGSAVEGNDGSAVKGNDGSAVKGNDGSAVKGKGALVACKKIQKSLDDIKLLEAFKYLLFSDDLFCKIRLVHINWLSEMGQQLERRCEFASALKYYYTGKAYYSKLDKFGSLPRGSDSKLAMRCFQTNPDGLYRTMFEALQEVAISEKHKDWAKKHWPSWATDEQKKSHLQECLNLRVSGEEPCIQTVLENAAQHLSVFFHFHLLPCAACSSDPHILLKYSASDSKFEFEAFPPIVPDEELSHGTLLSHGKLRKQFEQLFERLVPHSNKEAYENTVESVHFQKVVLRRGTMSK